MTTPKKPLSKTESAIQLGNILKFAGRGGGGKLRKIGQKPTKSSSKIGEVQTRSKKSLQKQKPDRSAKSSDWDARAYKQKDRVGHGKEIGSRATDTLKKKHPKAAMNKRIKAGTITNKPSRPQKTKYKKKTSPSNLVEIPAKHKVRSHPGLGGKIVAKPRPDASLQRAISDWKKKKGKK